MALGAGSVTPMQMVSAYSVFANGGYRVNPYLISRVTDHKGRILSDFQPPALAENMRAIDARNAFITDSLLQEVTRTGTAARAQATLKRPDIYGKTGTTNDAMDAWFAGFQPTIAAVTWIGYDTPRNLGSRETGGGLALPVWISFMERALKGVPVAEPTVPPGVVNVGGEWFYDEYARNGGVASVGRGRPCAGTRQRPRSDPRRATSARGAQPDPRPVQELIGKRKRGGHWVHPFLLSTAPGAWPSVPQEAITSLGIEAQRHPRLQAGVLIEHGKKTRRRPWCPASARRRSESGSRRCARPARFRAAAFAG